MKGLVSTIDIRPQVILSRNLFKVQPDKIKDIEVVRTVVGGKVL